MFISSMHCYLLWHSLLELVLLVMRLSWGFSPDKIWLFLVQRDFFPMTLKSLICASFPNALYQNFVWKKKKVGRFNIVFFTQNMEYRPILNLLLTLPGSSA